MRTWTCAPTSPRRRRPDSATPPPATDLVLGLQRAAGNRAVGRLLRQVAAAPRSLEPKRYKTYEEWLQSLPSGAVDETSVNVTGDVARSLPDLAGLVTDLRADCADVTILLKHYYYEAHGKNEEIPAIDSRSGERKVVKYKIGAGVSRRDLRRAVIDIGTIHFQEKGNRLAFIRYYGGTSPIRNLKKLLAAGLGPGDVLVWKRLPGVTGDFRGHVQTIQRVRPAAYVAPGHQGPEQEGAIEVLQGTMETGRGGFGQIQSKVLTFQLLTGTLDGDAEITYQPAGEEEFFGAGKW